MLTPLTITITSGIQFRLAASYWRGPDVRGGGRAGGKKSNIILCVRRYKYPAKIVFLLSVRISNLNHFECFKIAWQIGRASKTSNKTLQLIVSFQIEKCFACSQAAFEHISNFFKFQIFKFFKTRCLIRNQKSIRLSKRAKGLLCLCSVSGCIEPIQKRANSSVRYATAYS